MHILLLTNLLSYTDGISRHLFDLISGFNEWQPETKFTVLCGGGEAVEDFRKLNIPVMVEPKTLHSLRSPTNFMFAVGKVLSICRKHEIDIIHSHSHYLANIAYLSSVFSKWKTVQTNHGILDPVGFLPHLLAHKYIAINGHIVEYFLKDKIISSKKFAFIRCGISGTKYISKHESPKIVFLSAGRLTRSKGFSTYIEAVTLLEESVRNKCRFLIAGIGEEEKALKEYNEKLNAGIEFLGEIKNLRQFLAETDYLIIPSSSANEGFPRIIVEAAFAGNGIIAADFLGLQYDFTNGVDGFVFEKGNASMLASIIREIIKHPDIAEKRRNNFSRKALELFDQKTMIQKTSEVYSSLLR